MKEDSDEARRHSDQVSPLGRHRPSLSLKPTDVIHPQRTTLLGNWKR